ncbi:hypothetical protein BO70DRAFT_203338 [Aspergillus heteromorphus CBS 117.55]|uniref:Uncharacterized protein n=1 Tax=Aspergillus heteromorphus CBS 117.55 TaxID=1448321 RepID=A0A317WQ47_9EURO|nr:uncharacterized protein BO70DRAFT_203338 [Aspergillus heteromorphus CBS 117.55]PWY87791.1 hypothetical protein BO70DRAFT_203338 [Aspergillus heteromorphus CBS 117.55]
MADTATPSLSETRPGGNRKNNRQESESAGGLVGGLVLPGEQQGQDEKESLKIRIHLNLHAKVKLDLDAQLYGDIVIGLL